MLKTIIGVVMTIGILGCGSHHKEGSPGPDSDHHGNPQPSPGSSPGGGLDERPHEYESDLRDVRVAACQTVQLFALETCWDRMVWSDHGEIGLEGSAGQLQIVSANGEINSKVAALYQFGSEELGGVRVVSERISALQDANPMRGYWFLPSHLITVKPLNPGEPGMKLLQGEFSLGPWVPADGRAKICGQELALPLRQGAIEAACHVQIGDAYDWRLETPEASIELRFFAEAQDKAPGLLQRRSVYSMKIIRLYPHVGEGQ